MATHQIGISLDDKHFEKLRELQVIAKKSYSNMIADLLDQVIE